MKKTKITLVLGLCIVAFAYSSCKKEAPQVIDQSPPPCETKTWYEDADGDGKGNAAVSQENCDQPDGYVLDNTDVIDIPVQQTQVPILVKFMGETCPPCGGWGWAAWEGLIYSFQRQGFRLVKLR